MKKCTLIAVSAIALSLTTASLGDVLFDNFGFGDSYDTRAGYTLSEGAPINFDWDHGDAFTVGGGAFFLDSIDLAIGLLVGQNRIFVDVYTTVGGLPGVVIDAAVVDGQMGPFGNANPPIVALFAGSTILQDGEQYFIIASTDSDSLAAWNWNILGDIGPHAFRQDLGDWSVSNDTRGAFRVNGTLVPAPGVLALLGVAGLAARRRRRTMKRTTLFGVGGALLFAAPALAGGTTQYNDRATFESQLGTIILDDFQAEGYLHGDLVDEDFIDIHTNAHMSGILGETDYFTTGFDNANIITPFQGDHAYCAGCNGSFELGFTTTSVSSTNGVFGAGFDIEFNQADLPYHAFVTFGDFSTLDVALPAGVSFWAITSSLDIRSIHLGLADGGFTQDGGFVIDNLTIGNVPAPGVLGLLGVAGLAARRRRR